MPSALPDLDAATAAALAAGLAAIWCDLAADIARLAPVCTLRGMCCDFGKNDYVLYATSLEVLALGGTVDLARVTVPGNRCPFWINRRCMQHAGRPLGCRVYFCDPRYAPHAQEVHERHHRRIRDLADRLEIAYEYAPFLELLRRAARVP